MEDQIQYRIYKNWSILEAYLCLEFSLKKIDEVAGPIGKQF